LNQTSPRKLFDWSFWLVAGLTAVSVVVVLGRDGVATAKAILIDDLWLFAEILPKVIAGALIGELIRRLVPREVIVRWLGAGSGLKGLLVAAAVGALFPAGPFTVFPLAAMLLVAGADRGAAIAFVTGWLLLGLNRILIWELPFFGADLIMLRVAVSFWMPVFAGWAARQAPAGWGGPPRPETPQDPGAAPR
jgi:uncharacterized membrane protein YraQ (UPF0718 family)